MDKNPPNTPPNLEGRMPLGQKQQVRIDALLRRVTAAGNRLDSDEPMLKLPSEMAKLERAIAIAAEAHAGQFDKAGQPYILHPLRVMLAVNSEEERIAAVLHDVVEDNAAWPLARLAAEGFSPAVLSAIDALTKRPGETRLEAAARAKRHPVALRVKLADNAENMDLKRIPNPTEGDFARLEEYKAVRALLLGADLSNFRAPVLDTDLREIAEIVIRQEDGKYVVERTTFYNSFSCNVSEAEATRLRSAALALDWATLDDFDPEFLPWYCRKCGKIYSEDKWRVQVRFDPEDGWLDSYRGWCPSGHERMIAD